MSHQSSDTANAQAPPHQISCVICRQRKVKCDKQQICSNCMKAGVQCVYAVPARPRRRIGNGKSAEDVSREELIHRVRRYEALFRTHGIHLDVPKHQSDGGGNSNLASHNITNAALLHDQGPQQSQDDDVQSGLARQDGLWTEDLSGEILEDFFDRDSPSASPLDTPWEDSGHLTLAASFDSSPESLTSFHPSTKLIFKLWEKFLDNVNPLVKIIHVPTVQRQLLEASVDLSNVSRPFEALLFAIYASAITSLSNEECIELTDVPKLQLQNRYYKIAQQALTRAGIFATRDIVVLQAAVHAYLIISISPQYDPGEVYVLVGVALRVGERMGLHRKTYPANLSVIEIQTRRRLWWQIVALDSRCAQKSKIDVLANPQHWQSVLPLNINDSDLTPDMIVEPQGHVGSTEMTFRLMMYEIGKFIRHSAAMAPFGGSWQKLSSRSIPISAKDEVIDELEKMLESRYLRYCDPVIPLHILARSIATIVVSRMRLTTRHPRRFSDRGLSMAEEEKQRLFDISLKIIEQDNMLHSTDSVRGFAWLFNHEFQADAFVYLLSELRYRGPGPTTERAWLEVSKAFKYRPNLLFDAKIPLNAAIRNLTLKSWESWETRAQQQQNSRLSRPMFVSQLLEQRTPNGTTASTEYSGDNETMDLDNNGQISYMTTTTTDTNWDFGISAVSEPMAPIDWNYWNGLIQHAEDYPSFAIEDFVPQTEWSG